MAAHAYPEAEERWQVWRRILPIIILLALEALILIPDSAYAAAAADPNSAMACADAATGDFSHCLPIERWGGGIGAITFRADPIGKILGVDVSGASKAITSVKYVFPDVLLWMTQSLWRSAIGINQFAVSFSPLDKFGQKIDQMTGALWNGANMSGGITGSGLLDVLVLLGVFAWIGGAAFNLAGSNGRVGFKRMMGTIVSVVICAIIASGAAATPTGDNVAAGSAGKFGPWWTLQRVNETVNAMTGSLSLDNMASSSAAMASNKPNGASYNCQNYLQAMHDQYSNTNGMTAGQKSTHDAQSNIVLAINRTWEETALRNYVAMQFGNPTAGPSATMHQATNAQQAYCHFMESYAGTPASEQRALTDKEMHITIPDKAKGVLFAANGWADDRSPAIGGDKNTDTALEIKRYRQLVFWETCGAKGKGQVYARGGWSTMISNLGNAGDDIDNQGATVRNKKDTATGTITGSPAADLLTDKPTQLCQTALTGKAWNDVKNTKVDGDPGGYAAGMEAALGWRFDIPNTLDSWRVISDADGDDGANVDWTTVGNQVAEKDPTGLYASAKSTVDMMYGNSGSDTSGAVGAALGALISFIVWGLFGLIQVAAKIALCVMGLLYLAAWLWQAFPFGQSSRHAVWNWAKACGGLVMVGFIMGFIGTIATFIDTIILQFTSNMAGTFAYGVMASCAPLLAIWAIGLFCKKILKVGNPLSVKGMMEMTGSAALANGLHTGVQKAWRGGRNMARAWSTHKRHKKQDEYYSSQMARGGNAMASAEALAMALRAEDARKAAMEDKQERMAEAAVMRPTTVKDITPPNAKIDASGAHVTVNASKLHADSDYLDPADRAAIAAKKMSDQYDRTRQLVAQEKAAQEARRMAEAAAKAEGKWRFAQRRAGKKAYEEAMARPQMPSFAPSSTRKPRVTESQAKLTDSSHVDGSQQPAALPSATGTQKIGAAATAAAGGRQAASSPAARIAGSTPNTARQPRATASKPHHAYMPKGVHQMGTQRTTARMAVGQA